MAGVRFDQVAKQFGATTVIDRFSLEIRNGEFLVLVGPSGCGKSTLLRMIAGLEEPTGGTVLIDGRDVTHVAPKDRNVAMVFQNYALYPHMTVRDNLAFGLKMRRTDPAAIRRQVDEAAALLGIAPLLDRKPFQLSGGQKQRVAIGRAIVRHPDVFLFDEPLSNLDAKLRLEMRVELKRLHQRLKTTAVYVTHDQLEAMSLGDRVVVLHAGVVQQVGAPMEIYRHPANRFVAGFIGVPTMNFVAGRLSVERGRTVFRGSGLLWPVPPSRRPRIGAWVERPVVLGVRPEGLRLGPASRSAHGTGRIEVTEPLGQDVLVSLRVEDQPLTALSTASPRAGEACTVTIDPSAAHLFDTETGANLEAPDAAAPREAESTSRRRVPARRTERKTGGRLVRRARRPTRAR